MVAAGNSRKELDIMKSRIILNRERTAKAQKISIPIHGKGGELGIKAITGLVGLIETLKDCGTCQEVQSVFDAICGYNACCTRCEFIDEKGADELMELVSMLAGGKWQDVRIIAGKAQNEICMDRKGQRAVF